LGRRAEQPVPSPLLRVHVGRPRRPQRPHAPLPCFADGWGPRSAMSSTTNRSRAGLVPGKHRTEAGIPGIGCDLRVRMLYKSRGRLSALIFSIY
jgi:hypothetical protein